MKTKLTREEISKVFSQYIGQRVLMWNEENNQESGSRTFSILSVGIVTCRGYFNEDDKYITADVDYSVDRFILKLRELSSLSNEEVMDIAKLLCPGKEIIISRSNSNTIYITDKNTSFPLKTIELYHGFNHWVKTNGSSEVLPIIYQYLTSKGFAVPLFFGIDNSLNYKTAIDIGIAISNT